MSTSAFRDDKLNARRDNELASSEVAGFAGGLGEVTQMDLMEMEHLREAF